MQRTVHVDRLGLKTFIETWICKHSGIRIDVRAVLVTWLLTVGFAAVYAQDVEPRAYSRAPIGAKTVVMSYGFQYGDVLTDSALPISDVDIKLNSGILGYAHTFGIFRKQANLAVAIPYFHGWAKGTVFEEQLEVRRSGLGDARLRFTAMLRGAPALDRKEFASAKPKTLIGISVSVSAPTGQYDPRRLVNLGSNRWAFKPEVGISKPIGKWTVELASGVWLFTDNKDYFGGFKRKQDPLFSFQAHTSYTIRPRMWVAIGGTYFSGGKTTVNSIANADQKSNSRIGATFAYPLTGRQSLKFAWMRGLVTRFGTDMNFYGIGWQYTWF